MINNVLTFLPKNTVLLKINILKKKRMIFVDLHLIT